jgi:predicted GTPase
MPRALIAILFTAALCLVLPGGSATAEKVTGISTTITFANPEPGVYTGAVEAQRAACREGRRVTIVDDRNENGRSDHTDRTLAKTLSGREGTYTAKGSQAPKTDTLLVVVADKILGKASFCRSFTRIVAAQSR